MVTALYDAVVSHARKEPVRNRFAYSTYYWLVDLDALPRLPWPLRPLARFSARDHLGDPNASIRANITGFLAGEGVDVSGGRVLMLANARVLGYVFNPITVFWCYAADGALACVVAEVHNTYGDRHAYVLHPDALGRASVDKELYVSPFYGVSGRYQMRIGAPGEVLTFSVTLEQDGREPFVAAVRARRRPATTRELLRLAARHPWAPLLTSLLIRYQGIKLWLSGLRAISRPAHPVQRGVQ